jgi:hypothetical protein
MNCQTGHLHTIDFNGVAVVWRTAQDARDLSAIAAMLYGNVAGYYSAPLFDRFIAVALRYDLRQAVEQLSRMSTSRPAGQ